MLTNEGYVAIENNQVGTLLKINKLNKQLIIQVHGIEPHNLTKL